MSLEMKDIAELLSRTYGRAWRRWDKTPRWRVFRRRALARYCWTYLYLYTECIMIEAKKIALEGMRDDRRSGRVPEGSDDRTRDDE